MNNLARQIPLPSIPLQFLLSFLLPLSSLLKKNTPYPPPFPITSLPQLALASLSFLIIHSGHMTVPPPRVLISSPTLRVKTDPLNGCSEVYGSRRRKKATTISFEVAPRLQTASDGVQPLAPSMTGSSLMVRDIPFLPFPHPSGILIY